MSSRALNLRISSLDPNLPKAKKDCKICNRRRIRCDRSLPTCQKCGLRDLECPGYDLKLKWDQGVASRGRLAGKAVPVLQDRASDVMHISDISSQNEFADVSEMSIASSALQQVPIGGSLAHAFIANSNRLATISMQSSLASSMSPPHPDILQQNPDALQLLAHYRDVLAGTLVWVDSSENPWRLAMLPLANQEPALMYSILAFAAEHLSMRAPVASVERSGKAVAAAKYRDSSLRLLSQNLRNEMESFNQQEGVHKSESATRKGILATMIMHCQVEMVNTESPAWRYHLQGSHQMIQTWLSDPSRIDLSDSTNRFLIDETFMINVFASTSSFSVEEDALQFTSNDNDETIFGDFLRIVYEITRKERQLASNETTSVTSNDFLDLEKRLKDARVSTKIQAKRLLTTQDLQAGFDRVVDIYHYAGNIYAYQALAPVDVADSAISPLLASLLGELHVMPTDGPLAQDLAWPLFIASTECRYHPEEQKWLQRKMEESAESTGFASCQQAWQFLAKWWAQEGEAKDHSRWIGFARARAKKGFSFLVL